MKELYLQFIKVILINFCMGIIPILIIEFIKWLFIDKDI